MNGLKTLRRKRKDNIYILDHWMYCKYYSHTKLVNPTLIKALNPLLNYPKMKILNAIIIGTKITLIITSQAMAIQRIFKKFQKLPNNNFRTGFQNTNGSSQNINPQFGQIQAVLETLWSQTSHLNESYLLYLASDM